MPEEIDALKKIEGELPVEKDDDEMDVEDQARSLGWKPADEWQGDGPKGGYLDAEQYVAKFGNMVPFIRAQNKKLADELERSKNEIKEIRQAADEFRKFQQSALQRERQQNQQLIQQLEARRAQAISEGDGEGAVQAERQISQLRQQAPEPGSQANLPEIQAMTQKWLGRNDWFEREYEMRQWAERRGQELQGRGYNPPAILETVEKEVRQEFPQYFAGGRQAPPSPDGGRRRSMESFGRKSFDDLPDEAKAAYTKFKRLMPELTKKEFMAQYEWE